MTIKQEWVEVARYELAKIAAEGKYIAYGPLYDRLRSIHFPSWPARRNGHSWMANYLSPILGELGTLCRRNQEPLLTALVINGDTGYVGHGYPTSVFNRYDYTPERYTLHADVEARKCWVAFGAPENVINAD